MTNANRPARPIKDPLSAAQTEAAKILTEELNELGVEASKLQRGGMGIVRHEKDGNSLTNKQRFSRECGDVIALIDECKKLGMVDEDELKLAYQNKPEKLWNWSDHLGTAPQSKPSPLIPQNKHDPFLEKALRFATEMNEIKALPTVILCATTYTLTKLVALFSEGPRPVIEVSSISFKSALKKISEVNPSDLPIIIMTTMISYGFDLRKLGHCYATATCPLTPDLVAQYCGQFSELNAQFFSPLKKVVQAPLI